MRNTRRATTMIAVTALLIGGGVGLGAVASSLTTASIKPRPEQRMLPTQVAMAPDIDQEGAGKSWARTAFDGGLRQCPAMNAEFLAACEAEMKALGAKPDGAPGRYGGPLLVTKVVEQPAYEPEEPASDLYRTASYAPDEAAYADPRYPEDQHPPQP